MNFSLNSMRIFNEVAFAGHELKTEKFLGNCMTEILGKIARAESYQDLLDDKGACKNADRDPSQGFPYPNLHRWTR